MIHLWNKKIDHSATSGVTLLEVLLAISIAGAVLGVYMKGLSQSVRSQRSLEESSLAGSLAKSQISKLRLSFKSGNAPTNELKGAFDPPHDSFSWTATVFDGGQDSPFDLMVFFVYKESGQDGTETSIYRVETLLNGE